ncbi:hypothetical protein Agub_g2710 [Astrephomene gubernaculifera]|uniref:Uncharacterized protein n=1 Tax=Astrephomene gubernaculifera TaxID=47775 RepID=A0AAD3DJM5_9CHLO|nr:hypothetical protein Agub_g2710 [Astrephomene gubernaculifera]
MDTVKFDIERSESGRKKKPTFRIVAQLVLAMKRFQAALNPSYNYGENKANPRASSPTSGDRAMSGRTMSARTASGRTASGTITKSLSGRPDQAGKRHGYKGNLLLRPLPALPSEQETSA